MEMHKKVTIQVKHKEKRAKQDEPDVVEEVEVAPAAAPLTRPLPPMGALLVRVLFECVCAHSCCTFFTQACGDG